MSSTEFRMEHDFLGDREVPADAYYGVQTLRGAENFPITGYRIHPALIRSMGIVKKAAALANRDTGHLESKIADAIARAADDVIAGKLDDQFIVDPIQGGAGTSINMNANEVIANRALELLGHTKGRYEVISPNSHVNMAQSTNDAFPTGVRIATLEVQETHGGAAPPARSFCREGERVQRDNKDGPHTSPGRGADSSRSGVRGVPSRHRPRCRAYPGRRTAIPRSEHGRDRSRHRAERRSAYIESVAKYLAEFSGLPIKRAEDRVDATQNTDGYTEISAALKVCMMNLSKIANDLRLMASGPRCGLGELNLPARQPGSSIMPGKVNPVMAEVVNQVAFQVIGNDNTICRPQRRASSTRRYGAGAVLQSAPVDQHHEQCLRGVSQISGGGTYRQYRTHERLC